jgi:RNA polymerase sigma factor (sigma-70 family)
MKTVTIQGHAFEWNEADGLDPMAIGTLRNWILRQAKRFLRRGVILNLEMDDLIQAGNMGALKAARTFRPERSARYLTWANFNIVNEMRRLCDQEVHRSLDNSVGSQGCPVMKEMADPTDDAGMAESKMLLCKLLKKLDKCERRLIAEYYGIGVNRDPQTLKRLAGKYGVTSQCIADRLNKALCKMRIESEG